MCRKLGRDYYLSPATNIAKDLIGKIICVNNNGEILKGRITETEIYYGFNDSASHVNKGITNRNKLMFLQGGISYVYLCYGIHCLFNIVTGPKDHPEAVLIRSIVNFNGPGKLTKALGINMSHNNLDLTKSNDIYLEDDGYIPKKIIKGKRIGISYAKKEDQDKLWRFTES